MARSELGEENFEVETDCGPCVRWRPPGGEWSDWFYPEDFGGIRYCAPEDFHRLALVYLATAMGRAGTEGSKHGPK